MKRSQKVLLVLTSAAVLPVLLVTGMQSMKDTQTSARHDEVMANIASYLKEHMPTSLKTGRGK